MHHLAMLGASLLIRLSLLTGAAPPALHGYERETAAPTRSAPQLAMALPGPLRADTLRPRLPQQR